MLILLVLGSVAIAIAIIFGVAICCHRKAFQKWFFIAIYLFYRPSIKFNFSGRIYRYLRIYFMCICVSVRAVTYILQNEFPEAIQHANWTKPTNKQPNKRMNESVWVQSNSTTQQQQYKNEEEKQKIRSKTVKLWCNLRVISSSIPRILLRSISFFSASTSTWTSSSLYSASSQATRFVFC